MKREINVAKEVNAMASRDGATLDRLEQERVREARATQTRRTLRMRWLKEGDEKAERGEEKNPATGQDQKRAFVDAITERTTSTTFTLSSAIGNK